MKKFYSMLVCASVVMAASAQTTTLKAYQPVAKKAVTTEQADNNFRTMTKVNRNVELLQDMPVPASPKEAVSTTDVAGYYSIKYLDELSGTNYSGEMEVKAVDGSSTKLVFDFPYNSGTATKFLSLQATMIPTTGKITFTLSSQTTTLNDATIVFAHWAEDYKSFNSITKIEASYADDVITFDSDDIIGIAVTSKEGYYYTLFDEIKMIGFDPNANPNEGWTSLGNATLIDPWVMTAFTFDDGSNQYDYPWEVELQQNNTDTDLYRLVDPYITSKFPMLSYNQTTKLHGYIQFNIADPNHVVFDAVDAGFANSEMGITTMYCYNMLGWAVQYVGAPASTIISALGDNLMYTKYEDGVIKFDSREYEETDNDGNPTGEKGTEYDACFGIQGKIDAGLNWTGSNMTGAIYFPGKYDNSNGVNGIVTDKNADAPVEYFNLQGVKLNNPQAGQVVIRRQGSEVTKMIAR